MRAERPSGERAIARPSPRRTVDPSSKRYKYTRNPPPAATRPSSNRTHRPSPETSATRDQSSHERFRGALSPSTTAAISRSRVSREARMRASGATSRRVRVPAVCAMGRSRPPRLTARSDLGPSLRVAVNQISSPDGDQARPPALAHSGVSARAGRPGSTTFTHPGSSCRSGCSMKPARSPAGRPGGC